jgi:hypothetical protein
MHVIVGKLVWKIDSKVLQSIFISEVNYGLKIITKNFLLSCSSVKYIYFDVKCFSVSERALKHGVKNRKNF